MRSRNVIFTLLLLAAVFLFALFRKWREPQPQEALHRTPTHLRFYAFARCRMQCLAIGEDDILFLLKNGVINMNKSNRTHLPCPLIAVQGRAGRRYLRVLLEQCSNATYVVNCYNLEQQTICNCTTDYRPKQN